MTLKIIQSYNNSRKGQPTPDCIAADMKVCLCVSGLSDFFLIIVI